LCCRWACGISDLFGQFYPQINLYVDASMHRRRRIDWLGSRNCSPVFQQVVSSAAIL
jgi:hypothetical protein